MKKVLGVAVLLGTAVAAVGMLNAAEQQLQQPAWAYGVPPQGQPAVPPARDDGTMFSLPGSDKKFTFNQIRGRKDNDTPARVAPADWYPGDHPAMPKIVAEGDDSRGIVACSLCHYPNGKGRSENASPQGLSKEYIVRQLHDMRDDMRASAERRKANTQAMVSFAKAMSEDEIQAAANYFSSMKWTPWIKVVETTTVPKTRSQGGLFIPLTGADAGMEPIGNRIIEVPVDAQHTETLRDPRSPFIAYVPVGAVAKGKELVTTGGGGKTVQCALCHGADLNGIGSVPGIAARSPSYIARQLNDIQQGARHGDMADLMKQVVAKLTPDDMLNIVAYTASLPAPAAAPTKAASN
ncbi:MAG TPA: c-type cytochrome [Micropepsaceae bacterium]|jgi:cytochrome c553|nr:c-type cytochrome [Micropepsaceae bacterium]